MIAIGRKRRKVPCTRQALMIGLLTNDARILIGAYVIFLRAEKRKTKEIIPILRENSAEVWR